MRVIFYKSTAESNRVDKSSYLSKQFEISGVLKDQSSVISPTILIEASPISVPNSSGKASKSYDVVDDAGEKVVDGDGNQIVVSGLFEMLHKCNYAYIPEFSRYYFVEDVSSVRNRLWSVAMRVDPLMSFKDGIYGQSLFCLRTGKSTIYDYDLKDELMPVNSIPEATEKVASYSDGEGRFEPYTSFGHPVLLTYVSNDLSASPSGTLPMLGDWADSGPAYSQIPSSWQYKTLALSIADFVSLFNYIKGDDTKAGYVVNCMIYPFDCAKAGGATQSIVFADGYTTGASGVEVDQEAIHVRKAGHFDVSGKSAYRWMNRSPYLSYDILLPYKGWVPLDPDLVGDSAILSVAYAINPVTGEATVYVAKEEDASILYAGTCQLGAKLSFTTTNAKEIEDSNQRSALNLLMSVVGGAVSTGVGIASGNPLAVLGGVSAIGTGAANFGYALTHSHLTAQATFGSGELGSYCYPEAVLRTVWYPLMDWSAVDWNIFHLKMGFAHNKVEALSDLAGFYATFANVHLSGLDEAYSGEVSQITSLLESGVIL